MLEPVVITFALSAVIVSSGSFGYLVGFYVTARRWVRAH